MALTRQQGQARVTPQLAVAAGTVARSQTPDSVDGGLAGLVSPRGDRVQQRVDK